MFELIGLVLRSFMIIINICCCGCIWRPLLRTLFWTKPVEFKNRTPWSDMHFEYFVDTDDLEIYMLNLSVALTDHCDFATDDLVVAYDRDDKIISVELFYASRILHKCSVRENSPFIVHPFYYEDYDILEINLVNFTPPMITFKKTDEENVEVGIDNAGKIVSILLYNASDGVLKSLSEEERVKRAKAGRKRSEEIRLYELKEREEIKRKKDREIYERIRLELEEKEEMKREKEDRERYERIHSCELEEKKESKACERG